MRYRTKWRALTLIALLLLSSAACVPDGGDMDVPGPTEQLVVYVNPVFQSAIASAGYAFGKEYPMVDIQYRTFQDQEQYWDVMRTELMAGKGPDLVLFSFYEWYDLLKLLDAGAYWDLNRFIERDPTFDPDAYQQTVFEQSQYQGKRLYIPLYFQTFTALTTREALADFGVALSDRPSFREWSEALVKWIGAHPQELDRLFQSGVEMLYGESLASLFGLQLYDPDTKELWIDTDEFRQCMELLKALYPLMEREWEHPSTMDAKPMQALLHRDKLFYLVETHQFREAGALQEWDLLDTNEQLLSIPVPNQLGTQPTAYGWQMAAVNRNGRNPYNAYAFLKLLMSADQQTSVIPINREAAERRLRENFTRSEEAYASMLEDLQNVRYVHPFSPVQWEFLLESMEPWFTGERAYDVCLEALRGRLDTYVHE